MGQRIVDAPRAGPGPLRHSGYQLLCPRLGMRRSRSLVAMPQRMRGQQRKHIGDCSTVGREQRAFGVGDRLRQRLQRRHQRLRRALCAQRFTHCLQRRQRHRQRCPLRWLLLQHATQRMTARSMGISNALFDRLASRRWSRKRWFGRRLDVREWEFGIAGARRRAARGHFSPIPDSGPSAALRDRGRTVLASWFSRQRRARRRVTQHKRAVRVGRRGSALSPARRALRRGRGWRWVLRCWSRCVARRHSGRRCSRRC